jgi:hypothetical protein
MHGVWFPSVPVFLTGIVMILIARNRWEPVWDSDKMQAMFYSFGEDNVRAMYLVMGASMLVVGVLFACGVI